MRGVRVRPPSSPGPGNEATRYRVGVRLSPLLPVNCTYEEIAAELGVSKQNAYTETVIALGGLALRICPDLKA